MHEIKEKLMKELYEVEEKGKKAGGSKMSAGDLEYIHKLTDTIKNIDKIEMLEEGEDGYSEAGEWMGEGRMYGTSYARGRGRGRGRNARRDSMGRYSRDGGGSYEGGSYEGGGSYANGSYARGGQGGGRGGNRGGGRSSYVSSYDGYSMDEGIEEMMEKAEELLEMAENPQQKQAIHKFIKELERM